VNRRSLHRAPARNPHIPIAASQVSHYSLLVIPTGAPQERSGGICSSAMLLGNVFRHQLFPYEAGGEKAVAWVKPGKGAQKIAGGEPLCRARVEDTFTL
jgi:hypothetical protein